MTDVKFRIVYRKGKGSHCTETGILPSRERLSDSLYYMFREVSSLKLIHELLIPFLSGILILGTGRRIFLMRHEIYECCEVCNASGCIPLLCN